MRRSRSEALLCLVVTKADLQNVFAVLERKKAQADAYRERRVAAQKDKYVSASTVSVRVTSVPSMGTEVEDGSIFDNDVIDLKKTVDVIFDYRFHELDQAIRLSLRETEKPSYRNELTVSGADPEWVDATFLELQEVIKSVKPQKNSFLQYNRIAFTVSAIAIGYSAIEVFLAIVGRPTPVEPLPASLSYIVNTPTLKYLLIALICFLLGALPASLLVDWVKKLWPDVEFDFGPEHLKAGKQVRSRLTVMASVVLLPLFIEVAKHYVLGWN